MVAFNFTTGSLPQIPNVNGLGKNEGTHQRGDKLDPPLHDSANLFAKTPGFGNISELGKNGFYGFPFLLPPQDQAKVSIQFSGALFAILGVGALLASINYLGPTIFDSSQRTWGRVVIDTVNGDSGDFAYKGALAIGGICGVALLGLVGWVAVDSLGDRQPAAPNHGQNREPGAEPQPHGVGVARPRQEADVEERLREAGNALRGFGWGSPRFDRSDEKGYGSSVGELQPTVGSPYRLPSRDTRFVSFSSNHGDVPGYRPSQSTVGAPWMPGRQYGSFYSGYDPRFLTSRNSEPQSPSSADNDEPLLLEPGAEGDVNRAPVEEGGPGYDDL